MAYREQTGYLRGPVPHLNRSSLRPQLWGGAQSQCARNVFSVQPTGMGFSLKPPKFLRKLQPLKAVAKVVTKVNKVLNPIGSAIVTKKTFPIIAPIAAGMILGPVAGAAVSTIVSQVMPPMAQQTNYPPPPPPAIPDGAPYSTPYMQASSGSSVAAPASSDQTSMSPQQSSNGAMPGWLLPAGIGIAALVLGGAMGRHSK
jgi:hypothetical protein